MAEPPPSITSAPTTGVAVLSSADLACLDEQQPLNLVCAPFLGTLSGDEYRENAASIASYCATRGAFLIADPPADWKSVDDVVRDAPLLAPLIAENGAVYWPPLTDAALSEAVAAVYVRMDETRGVWKAPAGSEASLGIVTPSMAATEQDTEVLAPLGVNAIRTFPRYGTVVWGARTMSTNPDYRYIQVRRTILYIEQSIKNSLQEWTVLQPNDESTWSAVRTRVNAFLTTLWRDGALAGSRPQEAYRVQCDASTMSPDDIANGRLVIVVGMAPLRPAEFIVLRIGMWTADRPDDDDDD